MDLSILQSLKFWQKFSTIFMFGLSLLFLTLVASKMGIASFTQRGPQVALAIQQDQCPNPGAPVTDCNDGQGNTGHKYCVFNASGNTIGQCVIEACVVPGATVNSAKTGCNLPAAQPAPPAAQSCGTTTQTTTQTSAPVCNGASISVSSGSVSSGQQITFTIHGDASTWVGDSNSGLSNCSGALTTDGTTVTCTANSSGSITHTWKHCEGDVNNCSSTCSATATFSVNQVSNCPAGTFFTTNSSGQQVCMPNQVVTPPPPPAPINITNNPTNTNTFNPTNNNNVTVNAPAPAQVVAQTPVRVITVAAGPVVTQQAAIPVKELPKTGLPLAGWLLGGLLPVGAKMRKFGSSFKDMFSANDVWAERQFKSTFRD